MINILLEWNGEDGDKDKDGEEEEMNEKPLNG